MLPSPRLIILVMAAAPLFLAGALYEGASAVGVLYLIVLAFYTALDALLLPRKKRILVSRNVAERVSVGYPTALSLTVENRTRRRLEIQIAQACPEEIEISPNLARAVIPPGGTVTLDFRLTARQRGEHQLGRIFVRALPALGLLYRQFTVDLPTRVQVYPNLMNVRRTELLARRGSSYEQGLARLRSIGQGFEFESLRKYVQGDELSRIEWKVTARRADLIVKNFEPERQQSILVAIDVGRATAGEFGGLSRVDYLVNATLMLAFIALRQRDQFSLVAFSDRIESYLPPVTGLKAIERVARALYRLQPRMVESDYGAACRFLGLKNRKRSLLCMMTDVIDRQASDVLIGYMARFARYHLPLAVTLSNPEIHGVAHQSLAACEDPYAKAVALDVLAAREEALISMRRKGVSVLDVPPDRLTPELINRYTQIKAMRRL
ncbi:MAG: DUF58 domain-containing protein [Phycisphaerales bacterium]